MYSKLVQSNFIRLRMQQLQVSFVAVVIFVSGFALGNQFAANAAQFEYTQPPESREAFEPFWQVYNFIENDFVDVDTLAADVLVNGAINGMIEALDDQYSGYMNPEVYPLMNDDLDGAIDGIGVVIRMLEDSEEIQVATVLPGTPASEAGILTGDVFAAVNGIAATELSQLELATQVRGVAGTEVMLTMRRGEDLIDFTLMRAHIDIPNVETRLLSSEQGDIGYIRLNQFSPEARTEIDTALDELDTETLSGIVLDFRGNPGGLLLSAVDVASAFMEDGVVLIEQFGDGSEQVFNSSGDHSDIVTPMVVLVDEGSASASELVAGALQDSGRATIIGETTVGKGTVQSWHELVNGGGIRLTIARWLTPNRHWIHHQGITPDIVIEWTPESYEEMGLPESDLQLESAITFLESEALVSQVEARQ
ncbi:MAG: S41 family peptidase [Burkholderiales bacterium]|nr:S41 family peptidase [Anaerolineae bacterium]